MGMYEGIDISKLTKDDIGRWVTYNDGHTMEHGRIKSWNDKYVFVVYACNNRWEHFQDYTGQSTRPEDLTFRRK
jgi:hypothetical protein